MTLGVSNFQSAARAAALIGVLLAGTMGAAQAQQDRSSLGGSWSGGGVLVTPSGNRERATCRATFRNQGGSSYAMSATCATASARVQQTAQISRTGGNNFAGSFHNAEYGVSGSISLRVNGNRLSASLDGGGASASLSLSRR